MRHIEFKTPDPKLADRIKQYLDCSPVTAALLAQRNIVGEDDLGAFFNPMLKKMRSPHQLKDVDKAVERIYRAVVEKEKILAFVDYDADGVCAGVVLMETLQALGADIVCYIPHREKEGYGLSVEHVNNFAVPEGVGLIITADCGSSAVEPVQEANRHGIDVIITDHHEISLQHLPQALAVVNPKREDDPSGLGDLAGVGVVFYLVICLRAFLRDKGFFKATQSSEPDLKQLTEVVALGTVADVVPLTGDNRILVHAGLEAIRSGSHRPGLMALMQTAGIDPEKITSTDIAFKLGPRVNAASRMDHARLALQLLMAAEHDEAEKLAGRLDRLNTKRKELQKEITEEVERYLVDNPDKLERKTLVVAKRGWPVGILGIVAGRLAEKYYRPVVLIAIDGDWGKGSARSIPGLNIFDGFSALADILEGYGGHDLAGGLKIHAGNLEEFRNRLEAYAADNLPAESLQPSLSVDYEIGFEEITEDLMDELDALQPFGQGNPEPVFLAKDVRASGSKILCGAHRRMFLEQPVSRSERSFCAIQFNLDNPEAPQTVNFKQITFRLAWNHWNGNRILQIMMIEGA